MNVATTPIEGHQTHIQAGKWDVGRRDCGVGAPGNGARGPGQGLEARTEPVSLPWVPRISQMTMCSPAAQAPWLG
jgi:hypothetical protein